MLTAPIAVWYLPSWIPFNSIHRAAEKGRQQVLDIVYGPMEQVKERMKEGGYPPSFVSNLLGENDEAIRKQLPWVAWSMFEGMFYAII